MSLIFVTFTRMVAGSPNRTGAAGGAIFIENTGDGFVGPDCPKLNDAKKRAGIANGNLMASVQPSVYVRLRLGSILNELSIINRRYFPPRVHQSAAPESSSRYPAVGVLRRLLQHAQPGTITPPCAIVQIISTFFASVLNRCPFGCTTVIVAWPVLLVLMSLTTPDLPTCEPPVTLHLAPSCSFLLITRRNLSPPLRRIQMNGPTPLPLQGAVGI